MNIIFAGTPEIATLPLKTLLESEHKVVAVYTQPDRPAGRGKKYTQSAVKELALSYSLPVEQVENFKSSESREKLASYQADIMVVMAYGLLLPSAVLNTPKYGCINIHVSLLPLFRGAAPVQWAILSGEKETGVSIMQMDVGLDTGPILNQQSFPINNQDSSEDVYKKMAEIIPPLLLKTLCDIDKGSAIKTEQNHALASYAPKINKQEAKIDWNENSEMIDRKVRAYYPSPIAFFEWQGEGVRIWQGHMLSYSGNEPAGKVISMNKQGLTIKTKDGAYCITCLQCAGKKALSGHELFNAYKGKFNV